MNFIQKLVKDLEIIETVLLEGISLDQIHLGVTRAVQLSSQTGFRKFLVDARSANPGLSLFHVFSFPELYDSLKLSRSSRIALLPPQSKRGMDMADFFETVCSNRGWTVKFFSAREQAVNWLVGSTS
jgi:hypothetical protein